MSNGIGFTFSQEPKMPNNASKVTNQLTLRAEEEASAEMGKHLGPRPRPDVVRQCQRDSCKRTQNWVLDQNSAYGRHNNHKQGRHSYTGATAGDCMRKLSADGARCGRFATRPTLCAGANAVTVTVNAAHHVVERKSSAGGVAVRWSDLLDCAHVVADTVFFNNAESKPVV